MTQSQDWLPSTARNFGEFDAEGMQSATRPPGVATPRHGVATLRPQDLLRHPFQQHRPLLHPRQEQGAHTTQDQVAFPPPITPALVLVQSDFPLGVAARDMETGSGAPPLAMPPD